MKRTDTIIIGGGQAGLAMSKSLADRGIDHVVLERGQVAERWRSERWDSLRLLTPRWQSRLPGRSYQGSDPHGFMSKSEVIAFLDDYARSASVPLHTGVRVTSLERGTEGFRVRTDAESWRAANVVLATGYCAEAFVPEAATGMAADVAQVVPTRYRNPESLREGGVLVVGASATGIQLASEIARSGRSVHLSVGRHIRMPRRYRGRDIMDWLEAMGVLTETTQQVFDIEASRRQPSLQLVGSEDHRSIDLDTLQEQGVRIMGRLTGAAGHRVYLAEDLPGSVSHAEARMHEQLDRVDHFITSRANSGAHPALRRPAPIHVPRAPRELDLKALGIETVLWATGYRRQYSWLQVPVLDARGELVHDGGITPEPGLYALGLNFMRRRNSAFLDGVGRDAAEIAHHMARRMADRYVIAA